MRVTEMLLAWAICLGWLMASPASVLAYQVGAVCRVHKPKTDNKIASLELSTGHLIWEHVPESLGDAHFELYSQGLIVYPDSDGNDRRNPLFVDAATGNTTEPFDCNPKSLQAVSATFAAPAKVALSNGWLLSGFSYGSTTTLCFRAPKSSDKEWVVESEKHLNDVRTWKSYVFLSYCEEAGAIYAYRWGNKKPAWKFDAGTIIRKLEIQGAEFNNMPFQIDEPRTEAFYRVIDGTLYVSAKEFVFAIEPRNGRVIWQRDLATELDLKFIPDFYEGGSHGAVFVKANDVLIISFERRIVALDLKAGKYLWHLQPDTFPSGQFPVAYDDKLYLTLGRHPVLHDMTKD